MGRSLEIIEADLGSINLTYTLERPLYPRVTPAIGRGGVEACILETTNTFARLLALRTFGMNAPLNLGVGFRESMISHHSRILIQNGSIEIAESLESYYQDLSSRINGL